MVGGAIFLHMKKKNLNSFNRRVCTVCVCTFVSVFKRLQMSMNEFGCECIVNVRLMADAASSSVSPIQPVCFMCPFGIPKCSVFLFSVVPWLFFYIINRYH